MSIQKNKKEQLIENEEQPITEKKKKVLSQKVLENLALGRQKRIDNLELKRKERDEEKTLNKKVTPSVRKYKSKTHKIQKLSEIRKINIIFSSTQEKEEFSYPICWGILKMSGSAFFT